MPMSPETTIHTAFLAVQKALETPKTDAEANTGKYSYAYLTLGKLVETVKPILNGAGFTYAWHYVPMDPSMIAHRMENQRDGMTEDGEVVVPFGVECVLTYVPTGDVKTSGALPFSPEGGDHQDTGRASTYGKRHTLLAVLGLPVEDDDAAKDRKRGANQRTQQGQSSRASGGGQSRPAQQSSNPDEAPPFSEWREMDAKMMSKCSLCGEAINVGDRILYTKGHPAVHAGCAL